MQIYTIEMEIKTNLVSQNGYKIMENLTGRIQIWESLAD